MNTTTKFLDEIKRYPGAKIVGEPFNRLGCIAVGVALYEVNLIVSHGEEWCVETYDAFAAHEELGHKNFAKLSIKGTAPTFAGAVNQYFKVRLTIKSDL